MNTTQPGIIISLIAIALFSLACDLSAEPVGFEVIDDPALSPPFLDEARTTAGVANAEAVAATDRAAGSPSENEKFLTRSYDAFRRAGYIVPALGPRVTYRDTGLQRFQVFQFDFDTYGLASNSFGIYMADRGCHNVNHEAFDRSWIAINSSKISGRPYERMSKLSHELFHAFEYAYPLFYTEPCPPDWIEEGLADAAANFLAEHAFRSDFKRNRKNYNRASLRSYRVAFQDEFDWAADDYFKNEFTSMLLSSGDKDGQESTKTKIVSAGVADGSQTAGETEAENKKKEKEDNARNVREVMMYLTSGFWQFLARRSTGQRADYSSPKEISELLAAWKPLVQREQGRVGNSAMGWLRVVDDYMRTGLALEKDPKMDVLYGWLPEFFTEYASWWHLRHPAMEEEFWLKNAFGGCEKIELKPGSKASRSSQKITLTNLRKNSARCVDIKLSGFTNPVTLKIKADKFGSTDPDQFHLGLAHIKIPGDKISPFSCWNNHNDSKRLECRRLAKAAKGNAKTWKAEQISSKSLEIEDGPIDATFTYVFSNVSPRIDKSTIAKSVDLTFSATYSYGGDKNFAPPNSIRPADVKNLSQMMSGNNKKQIFYRLYTSPPVGRPGLFNIELNQIEEGEQPRCGGDDKNTYCAYDTGGDYFIKPGPNVSFGQTGRITATVNKHPGNGPVLMSTYCSADADQRAVEILDSGDDGVVIRVNTDLCDVPGPHNNYCNRQPTCPVREHLLTTLTLGLGREHFGETAPVHELTPGTQFDMDLYYRYGVPTESSSSSSESSSGSNSGSSSSSSSADTGTAVPGMPAGTGGSLSNCSCSCEERENTLRQAEELKAREAAGENIPGAAFMDLMGCASSCQSEYLICELEKNREAEEAREAKRQTTTETSCDCSCTALAGLESRTQSLLEKFQSGNQSALAEMQQLGQCMSVCQNEMMSCYKSK